MARFESLTSSLMVHDLRKGIPFADESVDAVYHSHLFEHIDRSAVQGFLAEVRRVLKAGGIHRVAVPDWEKLCRDYISSLERCLAESGHVEHHHLMMAAMIDQMVRKEAFGTSQQPRFQRALENVLLGDARRRGEVHRWMYDRISLVDTLERAGFRNVAVVKFNESSIPNWSATRLEVNDDGTEYKSDSLYVEALK